MVEFLVDHDAYVDVCDNEGWTPLHATASCGFTEIARYSLCFISVRLFIHFIVILLIFFAIHFIVGMLPLHISWCTRHHFSSFYLIWGKHNLHSCFLFAFVFCYLRFIFVLVLYSSSALYLVFVVHRTCNASRLSQMFFSEFLYKFLFW